MKKPLVVKIVDGAASFNRNFNKTFNEEVFMPTVKLAVGLMVFLVLIDYSFQLIEAIEWLTL
jgi:hypothetical protein